MCRAIPIKLNRRQYGGTAHAGMTPESQNRANPARTAATTSGEAGGESTLVEGSRPNWPDVVLKVLELLEEGIFRTIMGFF